MGARHKHTLDLGTPEALGISGKATEDSVGIMSTGHVHISRFGYPEVLGI